jgi:hypothetical protein
MVWPACSEFINNFNKRAGTGELLLRNGEPTPAFYRVHGKVPAELAARLVRLARLHPGDYFLNNAFSKMQWLATMPFWERVDGQPFKRTPEFWRRAILRLLERWRGSGAPGLASRGLLPPRPWSADQTLYVQLIEVADTAAIAAIAAQLTPMAEQNFQASSLAETISTDAKARSFLDELRDSKFVTPRMKERIRFNLTARLSLPSIGS